MGGVGGVATGTYLLVELSFFFSLSIFETCPAFVYFIPVPGTEWKVWTGVLHVL